jgi:hypothetical protein
MNPVTEILLGNSPQINAQINEWSCAKIAMVWLEDRWNSDHHSQKDVGRTLKTSSYENIRGNQVERTKGESLGLRLKAATCIPILHDSLVEKHCWLRFRRVIYSAYKPYSGERNQLNEAKTQTLWYDHLVKITSSRLYVNKQLLKPKG